jgi:hypothetical protein
MSTGLKPAFLHVVVCAAALGGCSNPQVDAVKLEGSYRTLGQADESFKSKRFAEALPTYDEAVKTGVLRADVLAETYLKLACCKIETGDLAGATADLEQAERGGVAGEEYQKALKSLAEKKK